MRNFLVFISLLFICCEKENDNNVNEKIELAKTNLLGKWKLEASRVSPGGIVDWSDVEDGKEYTFFLNDTYIEYEPKRNEENIEGIFYIEDEEFYSTILIMEYEKNDQKYISRYSVELGTEKMILNGINCIEGCSYSFKRLE